MDQTAFVPNEEIRQELSAAVESTKWDELIAFEEWDNMVRIKFLGSEELQYMGNIYSSEEKELWHLFIQTITECLPTEYQQLVQTKYPSTSDPTKEELLNNNPALNSLVEKLGLDIIYAYS